MGDKALREQIAQAIHAAQCVCRNWNAHPRYSQNRFRDYADAVLPVVQAHEKDLLEEIEELAIDLAEERAAHQSLRDAVAQLADEMDREATAARDRDWPGISDHTKYGFSRFADGCDTTALRLRSLLPQEGQP